MSSPSRPLPRSSVPVPSPASPRGVRSATAVRRWRVGVLALAGLVPLLGSGCQGPAAPDQAVCQDLVHRLCLAPVCAQVSQLDVADCEAQALARTGCVQTDFTFTTPSRERVLECRAGLLHAGSSADTHPDCVDVQQMVGACADVVDFVSGGTR